MHNSIAAATLLHSIYPKLTTSPPL